MLVFSKEREGAPIRPPSERKVWFYEIKNDGYDPDKVSGGGRVETPDENGIPALLNTWAGYKSSGFISPPGPEALTRLKADAEEPACWWASVEKVAEAEFNLSAAPFKPSRPAKRSEENSLELIDELIRLNESHAKGLHGLRALVAKS